MGHNPTLAEVSPSPSPEPQGPELRLIQDGGELEPDAHDSERPDLYVVPDPVDPTEVEQDVFVEDDGDAEPLARRQRAAAQAGRVLSSVVGLVGSELTEVYRADHHRRRGGGGWLIREWMRKLAAEAKAKAEANEHENNCRCQICGSH